MLCVECEMFFLRLILISDGIRVGVIYVVKVIKCLWFNKN